ncbi:MAG: glycoside hydrolase family 140 protein [Pleurocapsa sp. MO_192.B19]|nr:glycoside hydrolase family 140 protein [Pleurocapsa sp. MO_192.B19]
MRRFFSLPLFALTLVFLVFVARVQEVDLNKSNVITAATPASAQPTIAPNPGNSEIYQGLDLKLPAYPAPTKLKIDSSKRFLVRADGSPFVWIGDTFWKFSRLTREQRLHLLDDRQSKGYNVVMIRVGTGTKGEPAGFSGNLQPIESHFQEMDHLVKEAKKRGMYIAIATGWWQIVQDFDADALYKFGKFIGDRYKDDDNIIWLSAGESGGHRRKQELAFKRVKSLVQGIRDGDTGNKLLTIHADFQRGTSISKMNTLVDFQNWQTSQWCCPDDLPRKDDRHWTVWEAIAYDYGQSPTKPTFDSEAWYENTNLGGGTPATPYNVRRRAYFSIFAGGFGHSYGGSGIWDATSNFDQALQLEGSTHIGYLSQLLHALGSDFLKLRPTQSMIVSGQSSNYDQHIQATSANDGSYALVYTAGTPSFTLDLSPLSSESVSVIWFNPRTKELSRGNAVTRRNQVNFATPGKGDWVLVLGR